MTNLRWIAVIYAIVLLFAASLNYIPGLTDGQGRSFGIFALDIFDDLLHVASAAWAAIAAYISTRASRAFLLYFGILYFGDGFLGLITGSGYLDLGIINYGIQNLPFGFKILANLPHLALGGFAILSVLLFGRNADA
ncbi:MAG: hypothetical protein P1V21_23785 [Rhizobiaceae bacterium]|nr:hypothetical protein [Rhizobiaceae bacterium]